MKMINTTAYFAHLFFLEHGTKLSPLLVSILYHTNGFHLHFDMVRFIIIIYQISCSEVPVLDCVIIPGDGIKSLGARLDKNPTFNKHVDEICKSVHYHTVRLYVTYAAT